MGLADLWFVIVAVFWTGFFVLEGFDFGVGVLHRVVARSETERRVAINTVGPFWDGNEVWLVVGTAAVFAAFPGWYATWFSASYLLVVVLLVALIVRGVSFEFRGKVESARWRRTWSGTLVVGSLVAPLAIGLALGNLVVGLPINVENEYTGTVWDLFTPYGSWTALTLLALCVLHGATFLGLRTTGELRERAHGVGRGMAWLSMVVLVVFGTWTLDMAQDDIATYVALTLAPIAVLVALTSVRRERDGRAFAATAAAMAATVGSLFLSLYPNVIVSSTDPTFSMTVAGTAAAGYALKVMTVVAVVFFPLVLLYQAWAYVVFRHRLSPDPPPDRDVSHPTQGPCQPPESATRPSAAAGPQDPAG